jgi:hypothetical protein
MPVTESAPNFAQHEGIVMIQHFDIDQLRGQGKNAHQCPGSRNGEI